MLSNHRGESFSFDLPDPLTVAVIGLGYVGLPLCGVMLDGGCRVIGVDSDPEKVGMLERGESYLHHLGVDFVRVLRDSTYFRPTTDRGLLAQADAVLICVPTPLDRENRPDLRFIEAAADDVARSLVIRDRLQIVVLESTTYPGTTREILKPALDETGVPYHLAFSPERVDPGRVDPPLVRIPKIVGGIDEESTTAAAAVYGKAFETIVPVGSCEIAESAKLMENIYRAVNIALVNEMKVVLDGMGVDIWEVVSAAATKPFGFSAFYPGPGLGGHCIPIDPFYLAWKAKQIGEEARFIELAGEVNRSMAGYVVDKAIEGVRASTGEEAKRVLVLGLAYKPDVDDLRESPSFEIIKLLQERGVTVDYSDPHVAMTKPMRHYGDLGLKSVELTAANLGSYDAVIISTAHRAFDWEFILEHARLIVDTRNALQGFESPKIIKA